MARAFTVDGPLEGVPLGRHIYFLEDRIGCLTLKDVQSTASVKLWKALSAETPGFGFTESTYWVRFTLENRSDKNKEIFIEQAYPHIDRLVFFFPEGREFRKINTGDYLPYKSRPIDHRTFVFPVDMKARQKATFYLRYQSTSSMNITLHLWSPGAFKVYAATGDRLLMLFYGAIAIMVIYNLLIYLFIRRIVFLYYVLDIFFYLLFLMTLDGTTYQFILPEYPQLLHRSFPLVLEFCLMFMSLFALELVELRTVRQPTYRKWMFNISVVHYSVGAVLIICSIFILYNLVMMGALAVFVYLMFFILICAIILIMKERHRAAIIGLVASSTLIIGAIAATLKSIGIVPSNFFTVWSAHIGSVMMVAIFSYALADRINMMGRKIIKQEKKYRRLVESSEDIIFSLDNDLNFLSINRAMTEHLGFFEDDLQETNFFDILDEPAGGETEISRAVIREYFNELGRTGKSVSFRANFKSKQFFEPTELLVKIEKTGDEKTRHVFMGKASHIPDDILLKYLESETYIYNVDNYLLNAELLSHRLTRNLVKYLDTSESQMIRLSLREMLINAIEHGNLDVQFDEKSRTLESGEYFNMIRDRQQDPGYSERKIHIHYHLSGDRIEYRITDQGRGFDHAHIMEKSRQAHEEMLLHGRGIVLASQTFDEMVYNDRGNEVLLIKYFSGVRGLD